MQHAKTIHLYQKLIQDKRLHTFLVLETFLSEWFDKCFNKLLSHQANPTSLVLCGSCAGTIMQLSNVACITLGWFLRYTSERIQQID